MIALPFLIVGNAQVGDPDFGPASLLNGYDQRDGSVCPQDDSSVTVGLLDKMLVLLNVCLPKAGDGGEIAYRSKKGGAQKNTGRLNHGYSLKNPPL